MAYEELSPGLTMTCPALLMRNTTDDPSWTSLIYHDHISWFPGAGYVVESSFAIITRNAFWLRPPATFTTSPTASASSTESPRRYRKAGSPVRLMPSLPPVQTVAASLSRPSIIEASGTRCSSACRARGFQQKRWRSCTPSPRDSWTQRLSNIRMRLPQLPGHSITRRTSPLTLILIRSWCLKSRRNSELIGREAWFNHRKMI